MYRAMQIANYVIYLALDRGIDVTNLHLQKILYYLQAAHLYGSGEPLFEGDIGKWRLGPVIPDVYHEYKEYGSQPIREIADELIFDEETMAVKLIEFDVNVISDETREGIDQHIKTLLDKDPFHLVDRTHQHEPWKLLRRQIESGERDLYYSNQEILEYFSAHPERLQEVLGGYF